MNQQLNINMEILKSRSVVVPVMEATEGTDNGGYPDYERYAKAHIAVKSYKDTGLFRVDLTAGTPEKARKACQMLVEGFLDRRSALSRQQIDSTGKPADEAKVAETLAPSEVEVIDEASLPVSPVRPRKAITLAIALALGLVSGSGFVVGKELLDRRIRTPEDVEKILGLPVIGVIPETDGTKVVGESLPVKVKRCFTTKRTGG